MRVLLWSLLLFVYAALNTVHADEISEQKLKAYLNSVRSVAIDFAQEDSQGNKALGTLLINKPQRFRCNYYHPFPLLIVGNKNYVSVYDYDMEDLSRIDLTENLFNFLLTNDVDFDKHFLIQSVSQSLEGIEFSLIHIDSDKRSKVLLDPSGANIKSITILEDDNTIKIRFDKPHYITKFPDSLFIIQNPTVFGAPKRINKEQLYNILIGQK